VQVGARLAELCDVVDVVDVEDWTAGDDETATLEENEANTFEEDEPTKLEENTAALEVEMPLLLLDIGELFEENASELLGDNTIELIEEDDEITCELDMATLLERDVDSCELIETGEEMDGDIVDIEADMDSEALGIVEDDATRLLNELDEDIETACELDMTTLFEETDVAAEALLDMNELGEGELGSLEEMEPIKELVADADELLGLLLHTPYSGMQPASQKSEVDPQKPNILPIRVISISLN
jgi:hypothetical protein